MSLPAQLPPATPDPAVAAWFLNREKLPKAVCRPGEFFVFFAQTIFPWLETYRPLLAELYCPNNGRPAWDPVRLLAILILQFVLRLPDSPAVEAVQYDLRWRLALHMGPKEMACDPAVVVLYRQRLLAGGQEGLTFRAVLDYLVAQGWLPKRSRQRLDSTHVCGLLEARSRLDCVRETIRLYLREVEAAAALPESWDQYWERYVENKVDPRAGKAALQTLAVQAGNDLAALWAAAAGQEGLADGESFQLLQRVFLENYQFEPTGGIAQTRAQPTGAMHTPHEPEAQWSSKSTTHDKNWIGYKTQIAETVLSDEKRLPREPTRNFLTSIVTQNATESDKPGMALTIQEQAQLGLEPPPVLHVDGAYVCGQALQDARMEGRALVGPAPAAPDRGVVYTAERFDVHLTERDASCPAGQRSTNCSRLEEQETGKVTYRLEWPRTACAGCALFQACVTAGHTHRTLLVGEHHDLLQARRREQTTPEYKKKMELRNSIEGTASELVRAYGLRHARYRGLRKVRLQNYVIGAACNIRRLFRRIQWEIEKKLRAPGICHALEA